MLLIGPPVKAWWSAPWIKAWLFQNMSVPTEKDIVTVWGVMGHKWVAIGSQLFFIMVLSIRQ